MYRKQSELNVLVGQNSGLGVKTGLFFLAKDQHATSLPVLQRSRFVVSVVSVAERV